jgi:hypothetical protein
VGGGGRDAVRMDGEAGCKVRHRFEVMGCVERAICELSMIGMFFLGCEIRTAERGPDCSCSVCRTTPQDIIVPVTLFHSQTYHDMPAK